MSSIYSIESAPFEKPVTFPGFTEDIVNEWGSQITPDDETRTLKNLMSFF